MAGEVLMSISKNERERAIFRSRRIALADYESDMVTAERVGGIAGRSVIARNAMQMNMSVDDTVT